MDFKTDIITAHAPLIHTARDIIFQITYQNGIAVATITNIGECNVQSALESYFSQVGIPVHNEAPVGLKNNSNLVFDTAFEFIPGTLEVYLSGNHLDPGTDFTTALTNDQFTIVLDPNDPNRLNAPPQQDEQLRVSYAMRITFNTKGGT